MNTTCKNPNLIRKLAGATAALLLCLAPVHAQTQIITWNDSTGNWNTGANWSTGAVPYIPASGTLIAIVNNGLANVAYGATGTTYRLFIADNAAATGTVSVAGDLLVSNLTYVGGNGNGTLIIENSGTLRITNSFRVGGYAAADAPYGDHIAGSGTGLLIVRGLLSGASRTIAAGFDGAGRIDVEASGTIINNDVYIGDAATGSGTINIWGRWQSAGANINFGDSGTNGIGSNVLNIYDGGSFIHNNAAAKVYIGKDAGSSGIVNIASGGTLTATGSMFSIGQAANTYGEVNVRGLLKFSGSSFAVGYTRSTAAATPDAAVGVLHIYESGTVIVDGPETAIGYMGFGSGASIASASGTAIVEGLWQNTGYLLVGRSGDGVLIIGESGTVTNTYASLARYSSTAVNAGISTGTAFVNGVWINSTYMDIGKSGDGHVTLYNGGTITVGTNVSIGVDVNSPGTPVAIASKGSADIAGYLRANGNLTVGNSGTGTLIVRDTGTVSIGGVGYIANAAGSSGTASVAGLLDITGNLAVGMSGTGYLSIVPGGRVNAATVAIGWSTNGTGYANVDGYLNVNNNLNLGNSAGSTGILDIASTGTVQVGTFVSLGQNATSSGTARVSGLWRITDNLNIGYAGNGSLDLQSGGAVIVGGTTIIGNTGNGTLRLNGGVLETRQLALGAGTPAILLNGGTLRAAASTDSFFLNFPVLDLGANTLTFDTQTFSVTATNAISASAGGTLVKRGDGDLVLTANSSVFAGVLNVQTGALVLAADPGAAGGAHLGGQVNVASGASIRSIATGTVNNLTINAGGALDLRTGAIAITNNVTLADGAIWRYSLTGTHVLDVTGTLAFDGAGTFYLDRSGKEINLIDGIYTLATYNAITGTANIANWQIAASDFSLTPSATLDTVSVPNALRIIINDASVDMLEWQGGNGLWDVTGTSWRRGANPTTWNDGALAVFSIGSGTVNLAGSRTIFGLQFDTDSYTIEGTGTLFASSTATINTPYATAKATINTAFEAAGLYKAGAGSLTLGGITTIDGGASVDGGLLTIASTGTMTAAGVSIADGATRTGTMNVAGQLTNSGSLFIGNSGDGALVVENGGVINQAKDTYVGYDDGASGLLHVKNGGVFKQTSGYIRVGGGTNTAITSSGTLIIETGGAVSGTSHIHIGSYGTGVAFVGGTLRSGGNTYIGVYEGAQGVVTIDQNGVLDTQSSLTLGYNALSSGTLVVIQGIAKAGSNLYLGQNADSTGNVLDIKNTGTVTVGGVGYIGNAVGASGTASVAGLLDITGNLAVGMNGTGYLSIANTGRVNSAVTALGWNANSAGHADVAGFWNITGNLNVGSNTNTLGTLSIANSGTVKTTTFLEVGYVDSGTGSVTVAGLLDIGSYMYIGDSGVGSLEIVNGGTVLAGATRHRIGNTATGTGSLVIRENGVLVAKTGMNVGFDGVGEIMVATGGTLVLDAATLYIAGDAGRTNTARGTVTINGYYRSGADGTYYQPVGYSNGAIGVFNVGTTGTVFTAGIDIGREAGASGTVTIAGYWRAAGSTPVGNSGTGTLIIEQTGTLIAGAADNTYVAAAVSGAASKGTIIVRGYLDSGTRNSNANANLSIGHAGVGVLDIDQTGTVIASGTGGDSLVFVAGANANSSGTVNVKGNLILNNGNALNGNAGTGYLNIASTGTVLVGGQYRQNQLSTLAITLDPARSAPYITAASMSLSGTLALGGSTPGYTPVAKASELPNTSILLFTATSGGIHGTFDTITGFGAGTPDYLMPGGHIQDEGSGVTTYRAGYRLAWNAPSGAHGTFTLAEGQTFEVDVPLADRVGEAAPGWDKKSLTKLGAGTLILSGENTFSGTVTVDAGTLRLGGPALHTYGALVNNGVFDFGSAAATGTNFRTAKVASLTGNGSLRMTVNPGTGASDRLIVNGKADGAHQLILSASPDATAPGAGSPAPALVSITGANNATFTGGLDYNGTNYAVVRSAAGSIILATNGQSGIEHPIHGVPGAQSIMWFASQDNLSRRIGELRSSGTLPAAGYSAWLRGRAESASIDDSADIRAFDMDLFGFELGADKTIAITNGRLAIGIYAGYGHASQDFNPRADIGTADGTSDQIGLGVYAAWLHNTGWFASLTLSAARYDNDFNTADQSGNTSRIAGDYSDNAFGASLEFGKRIALDRAIGQGWFAEPSAQLSLAQLLRDDYHTTGANNLDVRGSDTTVTRLRATLRAGRAWRQIELAGRIGASHETSSGGEITVDGASAGRPNVDGTRAEAGVGLIWRPTAAGQLYFDYEFVTGDGYQKPWAISFGYRHAF